MFSFLISLAVLLVGYFVYGKFVEHVFSPDNRTTPATKMSDGVDYMVLPTWKIFMIQFLNIAGTGPIFGAIMGAKFGPSCYLWIVFGCVFAGATHDYLSGMLSMRNGGMGWPGLVGKYLGSKMQKMMLLFSVLLLMLVGAVFVYSPAEILHSIGGTTLMWVFIIFAYYFIATMLPIDKIIGRIYPVFAISLLFMAGALFFVLVLKFPQLPEFWDGLGNKALTVDSSWKDSLFPCLFITVACGAISGFHATQTPLMARCLASEHKGRPIFYGAMITEGIVALIWAAVSSYFFYATPVPGSQIIDTPLSAGFITSAPKVAYIICNDWLGVVGGLLALLGIVAAPITSGDTALRSARLCVAEFFHIDQKPVSRRLYVSVPIFLFTILLLIWQVENPDGFKTIWQYFGWANQTMSVVTLWMLSVYLAHKRKPYIITLIPAMFMTMVCSSFFLMSPQMLHLGSVLGYSLAALFTIIVTGVFLRKAVCARK